MADRVEVVIVDVNVPFSRAVMVLVTWSLAAIPAAIVVTIWLGGTLWLLARVLGESYKLGLGQ